MARNVFMLLAYDGTDFHGWQTQPGFRTVQDVLEQALRRVLRHQVDLIGSGRTDAGVHAAGQVANFRTTMPLRADRLQHAIGSRLPKDLCVLELFDVHPQFHATRSAVAKLYRYRVHASPRRPVERFSHRHSYHFWNPLDVGLMREASRYFIGQQDFAAVAAKGNATQSTLRTVFRCDIDRTDDEIRIHVLGGGFLYNQVRIMVGTLLQVGLGRWAPDKIRQILDSRDRASAGPTAPALGLCLQWVRYPASLLLAPPSSTDQSASGFPESFAPQALDLSTRSVESDE